MQMIEKTSIAVCFAYFLCKKVRTTDFLTRLLENFKLFQPNFTVLVTVTSHLAAFIVP